MKPGITLICTSKWLKSPYQIPRRFLILKPFLFLKPPRRVVPNSVWLLIIFSHPTYELRTALTREYWAKTGNWRFLDSRLRAAAVPANKDFFPIGSPVPCLLPPRTGFCTHRLPCNRGSCICSSLIYLPCCTSVICCVLPEKKKCSFSNWTGSFLLIYSAVCVLLTELLHQVCPSVYR